MTVKARVALNDCRCAFLKHTPELQGEEFRISWVALVSLLRAVGHVLHETDSLRNLHLKKAIDDAWADLRETKPKPDIFWEFIFKECNNVLKRYRIGASRMAGEPARPGQLNTNVDLGTMQSKTGCAASARFSGPVVITSKIASGPFGGRDELDVAAEAIEWWERYLDRIDCEASRLAK